MRVHSRPSTRVCVLLGHKACNERYRFVGKIDIRHLLGPAGPTFDYSKINLCTVWKESGDTLHPLSQSSIGVSHKHTNCPNRHNCTVCMTFVILLHSFCTVMQLLDWWYCSSNFFFSSQGNLEVDYCPIRCNSLVLFDPGLHCLVLNSWVWSRIVRDIIWKWRLEFFPI